MKRVSRWGWYACVACVVAMGGWAGCATAPEEPLLEANLVDVKFTDATLFETVAVAEVRLTNLSSEEVQVTGATHKVSLNGTSLGRGVSADRVAVPRLGTATQRVEFHLRNLALARTLHDLSRSGVLHYELDGTVYAVPAGKRERGVKVTRAGDLNLNNLVPESRTGASRSAEPPIGKAAGPENGNPAGQ